MRLVEKVHGFPGQLSSHVGGTVVTGCPLTDIVPVEPAWMEDRVVVQFNKDDVDDLGLVKMDMLGLRTLPMVAGTLDLVECATGDRPDLDALPLDDPDAYQMCSAADTIGILQISHAQMMTLPRTQPKEFNDLVVEVVISRPGPIQGGPSCNHLESLESRVKRVGELRSFHRSREDRPKAIAEYDRPRASSRLSPTDNSTLCR